MKTRLFIPGPVNQGSQTLRLGNKDLPYYRDPKFAKMTLDNEKLLLQKINCKGGRVIPYCSSGTGAMDAVMTSLISIKDKILVFNGGSFGSRWAQMCKFYGYKDIDVWDTGFGKNISNKQIEKKIRAGKYSVILMQHDETDSGQLYDVEYVGKLAKELNIFLVVDAISSFLCDEYNMDKFNVDATIISTQKALKLGAGGSFLILNNKAIARARSRTGPKSFYFDINTYLEDNNLGRGYVPYTPNILLTYQLNQRLQQLDVNKEISKTSSKASYFRELIKDLPVQIVAENPSNFLTGLVITDKTKTAEQLYNYLKKYNVYITKPGKKISGIDKEYIRITHFGLSKKDYLYLYNKMKVFFS